MQCKFFVSSTYCVWLIERDESGAQTIGKQKRAISVAKLKTSKEYLKDIWDI